MVEVAGLALAGSVGEAYHAGVGLLVGAGFVEAYLALFADTDDQQVHPAGNLVIFGAVLRQLFRGNGTVRDVDVFLFDVHQVQQGLVKTVVAALGFLLGGRVVLVDGDDFHVLEGNETGLIAAGQLIVQGDGGRTRGETQAEQTVLVGVDGFYDDVCDGVGCRS